MKLTSIYLAVAIAAAATPALAVPSWEVSSGFNTGRWDYGQRSGAGCVSPAGLLSYAYSGPSGTNFTGHQGVNTPVIVPLVAKNLASTGTTVYSTAQIPAGAVWMHPGETGVNPKCAVVRFKAPNAGIYHVKGLFRSVDIYPNTVRGYIFASSNVAVGGPLTLTGPIGSSVPFDKIVTVTTGQKWIDFALDDGGSYYNDSTQLELTVTRCRAVGNGNGNGKGGDKGDAAGGGNGDNGHDIKDESCAKIDPR